jgi:hypothetical protein
MTTETALRATAQDMWRACWLSVLEWDDIVGQERSDA